MQEKHKIFERSNRLLFLKFAIIALLFGIGRFGFVMVKAIDEAQIVEQGRLAKIQLDKCYDRIGGDDVWWCDRDFIRESTLKEARKKWFSLLPSSYILGVFLGSISIGLILFIIYFYLQIRVKSIEKKKERQLVGTIKNSKTIGKSFNDKEQSLNQLKELGVLSNEEYQEKHKALIKEAASTMESEIEVQKIEEIRAGLKKALENGIITKEEFESKISEITKK